MALLAQAIAFGLGLGATPDWPSSVHVDPDQGTVDSIYGQMHQNEMGNSRYAYLFTPGYHSTNVNVGYYTSVYGLGAKPSDTTIKSVKCDQAFDTALNTFWRSAENFKMDGTMYWAVSQAAPLRRVEINGNLHLSESGYSSGGFLGDAEVNGNVYPGSQQQWMTRNTKMNYWSGGNWNFVYVGCEGAPGQKCGHQQKTVVAETPIIAEKPFMTVEGDDWYLNLPAIEQNVKGTSWSRGTSASKISFDRVYIARDSDISGLNSAIDNTDYDAIILSPGIYQLTKTLTVNRALTIMGLGMATVIPPGLDSALVVEKDVKNVRIAAILFQAATQSATTPGATQATKPLVVVGGYQTVISDFFARVGGTNYPNKGQARSDIMLHITGKGVIMDNSWLWRADHGVSGKVYNEDNPNYNAIVVDGEDFTTYGLAAEHALKDISVFNGENAQVYFYQCELPYDANGGWDYKGYKVADNVSYHKGYGMGVYTFFRDHYSNPVAFSAPQNCGIDMVNLLTVHLTGNGGTAHVINNQGGSVSSGNMYSNVCDFKGDGNCANTPSPLPMSPTPAPVPGQPTTPKPAPPSSKAVCVPKPYANGNDVYRNLQWACNNAIDCSDAPAECHNDMVNGQYTHQKHASWVFSKYYYLEAKNGGTCDFAGTAEMSTEPAHPECVYPAAKMREGYGVVAEMVAPALAHALFE